MSATTAVPHQPGHPELDITGTPPVPFWRLTLVELRKSYDTRASFWLLIAIAAAAVLIEGVIVIACIVQDESAALGDIIVNAAFANLVLLPILAIMLVTTEWSQRTAMVTFALEPRRVHVMMAKLVVGLILTVVSAVVLLVSGVVGELVLGLARGEFDWTLHGEFIVGLMLIAQALAMIGGFAFATLLLNTPGSIVAFFLYRFALPLVFGVAAGLISSFEGFSHWINFQRASVPIWDLTLSGGQEWGQLIVSGIIWLVLPFGFGLWRILRAEVK